MITVVFTVVNSVHKSTEYFEDILLRMSDFPIKQRAFNSSSHWRKINSSMLAVTFLEDEPVTFMT